MVSPEENSVFCVNGRSKRVAASPHSTAKTFKNSIEAKEVFSLLRILCFAAPADVNFSHFLRATFLYQS
jgi:hypothetical protein